MRRVAALSILVLAAGSSLGVTISTPPPTELTPTTTVLVEDPGESSALLPQVATDGNLLVADANGGAVVFVGGGSTWTRVAQLSGASGHPYVGGGTVVIDGLVYHSTSYMGWKREGIVPWDSWAAVYDSTIIVEGLAYDRCAQWEQTATLTTDDGVVPRGPWALYGDTAVGLANGAAYVFGRPSGSTTWTQRARLAPQDGAAGFDRGVSLSDSRLAIGAVDSVYVYALDHGSWIEEAKLTPGPGGGALHLSGATIVAGSVVYRLGDGNDGKWAARGLLPSGYASPPDVGGSVVVRGVSEQHYLGTRTVTRHGRYERVLVWDYNWMTDEWGWMWSNRWNPDTVWTSEDPYYSNRSVVQVFSVTNLPPPPAAVTVEFSPRTATIGTRVTVTATGTSLGAMRGRVLVLRGQKKPLALHVTRWEAGVAEGVVTKPLPAGSYDVCVEERGGRRVVERGGLRFVAPQIASVAPTGGSRGTTVVVSCLDLGSKKGAVFLEDTSMPRPVRARCKVVDWTAGGEDGDEVQFRVPSGLEHGTAYDVVVVNAVGEARAPRAFTR